MPNNLSQFWQELKRRKVTSVITVYAAAAFVILELVDIVAPNLGLPTWTFNFVLILLLVGFVITVIVSWIYDIHPEGGIVKTEPAHKVKPEDIPKSSNSWKVASYISFVVILGLIVLNIIPRSNINRKVLEKSIAVLPLDYLSEDPDKEYLANGVLDAITGNLSMIEGLRVMPRTSVEQYRENKKSAKEIGEELDVSYLIEGSFQMIDDKVKLIIQLVAAAEGEHIFFKEYDREYKDIFAVQSEVAKTIAREIKVAITPEEIQRIENIPTTSLTALDYYQEARENYWDYWFDRDIVALKRAEGLYNKALDIDSTFAQAYNGLAWTYFAIHSMEEYLSESYLDSVLIFTDMALSYNPDLSETYVIRGRYYGAKNNFEQAIIEYDKALQLNSNEWMAYAFKAYLLRGDIDFLQTIENLHKAINLNRGQELPLLLSYLSDAYVIIGFEEQGRKYLRQCLDLTGDSLYYYRLERLESDSNSREDNIEYYQNLLRIDSSNYGAMFQIAENYAFLGNYQESLKYYEKLLLTGEVLSSRYHRVGYAYWQNGDKEKANYYFDKQIEYSLGEINLGRESAGRYYSYYNLAGTYAFRGEKNKAYENLRIFNQKEKMPQWIASLIRRDPLFDSIRDEPEFQQIVRDVETKYQAEHERVRQWLEENGML